MEAVNIVEAVVAKAGDLQDGEMKEVTLGEAGKVLLIKEKSVFKAIGNKCTHYGAPLKDGVLCNGKIRCPWHGACFNVTTGDIEDSPGLDSIHTFQVRVEGDNVIVSAPAEELKVWKRAPRTASCDKSDSRLFVIIGSGASGQAAAEALRGGGFSGRILLITKENVLPYDRIKLSKSMNAKVESILLRPESFYQNHNIEILFGKEVAHLDAASKSITLASGENITYDGCLIATGGIPRRLSVPGADLDKIYCLRVPEDAQRIAENAEGKNLVIVGSSFIGMEVAATLASKAKSVSVIGMEKVPFERVLGTEVGSALQKLHESKGVKFYLSRVTTEFQGESSVKAVVLDDGTVLEADVVAIGAGIIPATSFIKGGVNLASDQSIIVDEFLKAADELWAAGDVARYPYPVTGELIRVEHWGMAQTQGRVAAHNFLNKEPKKMDSVPFFWTVQFGKSIRYAGHATSFDEVIVHGNPDELKFAAYYLKQGKALAVATLGMDPLASAAAHLLALNKLPSASELKAGSLDFKAYL